MSKEIFQSDDNFDDLFGLGESQKYQGEHVNEDQELEEALGNIWDIAHENHLDPFPTKFEVVPANIMNQIGSYGIPDRFSHWTFGRQYRQMQTQYNYGLSKIYELVINSDPSQAFLLENNPPIDNKFVMAHVLGHTDFFKNNYMFADTRRDMPSVSARYAQRIRGFEEEHGELEVEKFLDAVLSIEEHIDPYQIKRPSAQEELDRWRQDAERAARPKEIPQHEFSDLFEAGPPEHTVRELGRVALKVPPKPDRDLLGFIRNHAPYLEEWQRDTIDMVRNESLYFYPQRRTKIMNEGWAAFWHKRIMREMSNRDLITPAEDEAWWKVHSSVVAPNPRQLNPYYLGMKVYEYLEDYYNGNLTTSEANWLRRQGHEIYPHFEGELKDSPASEKLREVMMMNDDQSFIRNYFDKNVADRMNMYVFEEYTDATGQTHKVVSDTGWEAIRSKLTEQLDNASTPYITVVNGDYRRSGELYLLHHFDGRELDNSYISKTLPYLYSMWQRPVHLETVNSEGEPVTYKYNGQSVVRNN